MIKGNLTSPAPPSEMETFIIRVRPEFYNSVLFFGLKVNNSRGNVSDVSNIVSASPRSQTVTSKPNDSSSFFTTVMLVIIFVVAALVLVLIIGGWFLHHKKYLGRRDAGQQDSTNEEEVAV